ncbi:Inner membrane protein YqiK [Pontiella desulfatans]|uniref:Inner membrane protein YqiK n=1 Tax=Pontiella desulfatans TaxID=2750659 RepID=A0A6C2TVF3_PONDE|nr:hypothetical protein [Pontiella desulfatans]VGO11620.1 Inner membrane protein YqiK [Pontiella desulfatans]
MSFIFEATRIIIGVVALLVLGLLAVIVKCYRKVEQGTAIIRTGVGGTRVSFEGILVFPVIHRMELMEISVKRIEIDRAGVDGLICKDNLRADLKVAFFVRVNKTPEDVLNVAQCLGCKRASDPVALVEFFDAKFSEALKTVGKKFDFVELYSNRDTFKEEIIKVIGTDLNGYVLDDAAIDYLEQTRLELLNPNNILDAEGIKKITELTARQAILANDIARDKEKVIKKQDVEAREAILELEKQQEEAEQKQQREIAEITAREQAEAMKVQEEERMKSEKARIQTDEELAVANENKDRQIIVAAKNKERTDLVESERIIKDRDLEATERERIVTLAQIERDKAVEIEKKNIQEVIRERVMVERNVVEEEEHIKDTQEFAAADRSKQVALTKAAEEAEQNLLIETKAAEARKEAMRHEAEQMVIKAEAERAASEKSADARKILADAQAEEEAVLGIGEARALDAKAAATEKFGIAEANVIQKKAEAEAAAIQKQGEAEAVVIGSKASAEAKGIDEKAAAMKKFDSVGKEHEEFKLELNKDLEIELAHVNVQKDIAREQAAVIAEALKSARIDIVGGDNTFFDKIVDSVTKGKSFDRMIDNSTALTGIKETLFNGDSGNFTEQLHRFTSQFGMDSEDLKNISVATALTQMIVQADEGTKGILEKFLSSAKKAGIADQMASKFLGK